MSSSRNSPPDTNPVGYHINHPIRPPTLTMCERGASFTDSSLPSGHVYIKTTTPKYMRPASHDLTHADTIRLSAPSANLPSVEIYLNDTIINRTLHTLHQHSPFSDTRHVLSTTFLAVVKLPNNDEAIPQFHRRFLERPDDPSLDSCFLLLPINITPTHWTLLVRQQDVTKDSTTISHDSLSIPLDLTSTQAHLRHYDTTMHLTHGFTSPPIRHVPAVMQRDEYNYGICLLTTAIIYFYHPHPTHYPWYLFNYHAAANHMRLVFLSVLATYQPPHLQEILPPRPTSSLSTHIPPPPCKPHDTHRADPSSVDNTSNNTVNIPHHSTMPRFTKIASWNIDR